MAPFAAGYQPPTKRQPTPTNISPRRRFPPPALRLLPVMFANIKHSPRHPGSFPGDLFQEHIWPASPIMISDHHILSLQPETQYFGIGYLVKVEGRAWNDHLITRGTTIVFRGCNSTITKYIATWLLEEKDDIAFVQFTAFRIDQQTHYHDPDWPTLRITVPADLCRVPLQPTESLSSRQELSSLTSFHPISPEPPKLPWWKAIYQLWARPSNKAATGVMDF